jgi:chorismate mutase
MTRDEIARLRDRLAQVDLALVEGVNERLRLVAELKRVKAELGVEFLDPAREAYMLEWLGERQGGPLGDEGLRELHTALLALTKRELGRGAG